MNLGVLNFARSRFVAQDDGGVVARRIGRLVAHEGLMLEVEGLRNPVGTQARIALGDGRSVSGEIVGFRGGKSLVLPFATNVPFAAGARVEAGGTAGLAECGPSLLGRIIDAEGQALDGKGSIPGRVLWPIAGKRSNPLHRGRVERQLDVGVRSINGLLTVGEGQRVILVAGSGVGKTVLMSQILDGADCDVFVVALVGERAREVADFVELRMLSENARRTVVIAVPADHPPQFRIRAAQRATAIAEYFRSEGKRVFLFVDSLTRVAHAQREIGLALGEPPTMKGYPPSVLGLAPQLLERVGVDRHGGGSITAFYTVLADGDDMNDPIVDSARAIADGHIVLSRDLAQRSVYPAIDIGRSLSRVMDDLVDEPHREAASTVRRLWSLYEHNHDLLMMGAYSPGADPELDRAIEAHPRILQFLSQPAASTVTFAASRAALIEGFGQ